MSAGLQRIDPGDVADVAGVLANSSWVPKDWKDGQGRPRTGDIVAGVMVCRTLDIPEINLFRYLWVFDGNVNLTAECQRVLCARAGYDLEIVTQSDAEATVRIRYRGGEWHTVTHTLEDAKTAKLAAKDTWQKYPRRMNVAAACRQAVSFYASEVKAGIERAGVDYDEPAGPAPAGGSGESAGPVHTPGDAPPPGPALTPGGATIPTARREAPIGDDERADLLAAIEALGELAPDVHAAIRALWKECNLPNLRLEQLSKGDGLLMAFLIGSGGIAPDVADVCAEILEAAEAVRVAAGVDQDDAAEDVVEYDAAGEVVVEYAPGEEPFE
jgi:hypothetical protein